MAVYYGYYCMALMKVCEWVESLKGVWTTAVHVACSAQSLMKHVEVKGQINSCNLEK
jgi:hypothetical protein